MKAVQFFVLCLIIIKVKGIKLYFYDSNNMETHKEIKADNLDIIDPALPVKVIVHGWNDDAQTEWYKTIKNEYLVSDFYTIIEVDWSDYSMRDYYSSAKCTEYVGDSLGKILSFISINTKIRLDDIHMICHCLGAHVCGQAGRTIKELTGTKVNRITALDPAGPLFETYAIFKPLSKTNGVLVDVIHTDGGILGYEYPLGKADFYPNGGQRPLPECLTIYNKGVDFEDFVWCNHRWSISYFIASINNATFIGTKCDNWPDYVSGKCDDNQRAVMGDDISDIPELGGTYYLKTV